MEAAAAARGSGAAAGRGRGPAGAGRALLAPEQQERSAGEGWTSHRGLLPPILQRWWWGGEGALVCPPGSAEQVKLMHHF